MPRYAERRVASHFRPDKANVDVEAGSPLHACDTVSFQVRSDRPTQRNATQHIYIALTQYSFSQVVDTAGNAVSMVNSNYMGFGSGLIPRGCGFTLQNRGANFSLVPGHRNVVAGGKRPYHTILPALLVDSATRDLAASFTVMGGFMQPQGHLQVCVCVRAFICSLVPSFVPSFLRSFVPLFLPLFIRPFVVHTKHARAPSRTLARSKVLLNLRDFRMGPQAALDAPRICLMETGVVAVEEGEVNERMNERTNERTNECERPTNECERM